MPAGQVKPRRKPARYTDYWRRQAELAESRPGLSGSEKRRKRKGGNPEGGPGQRGRHRQPIRSRRGYLAPFVTELPALEARREAARKDLRR